jgi:hypothetical protein
METKSNKVRVQLSPCCEGEITRVLDRTELSTVQDVYQLLQMMERAQPLSGVELLIQHALKSNMAEFGGAYAMLRLAGDDQIIRYIEVPVRKLGNLPYDNICLAI